MTYCPSCFRHSVADTIPALKYAGEWVPAFVCCAWCGWCIKEIIPEEESA